MKQLKRILFLLLAILLSTFSFQEASAAKTNLPDGFLIGDETGINVSRDGEYFFDLNDLHPGDTFKRTLIIRNFRDEAYELKLVIQPKSTTGKIDLIENMSMEIHLEDQEVFQGNLTTHKDGSNEIPLGLIDARSEKAATIDLTMKEIEKWNQLYYSGPSEAEVEWQFVATYSKSNESNSEKPATKSPIGSKESSTGAYPSTGETLMSSVAFLGLLLVALVCWIKINRKRTE